MWLALNFLEHIVVSLDHLKIKLYRTMVPKFSSFNDLFVINLESSNLKKL